MKQFGRLILDIKCARDMSTMDMFKALGWLPIDTRADYFLGVLVYKSLHGLTPDYLSNIFRYLKDVHNVTTRRSHTNNLYEPRAKTKFGEMSISYSGSRLWNKLPDHIKNQQTLNSFKKHYMNFCLLNAFNCDRFYLDK